MKKTIAIPSLIICLLAVCVSGVAAEDSQTDKKFGLTGYLMMDTYSSYVDKISGETLHNGPVVHPHLLIAAEPLGAYLFVGIYNNFKGFNKHSANSLEYAVGIEREIGIIKLDAGYGYSDIKNSKGDVHYFYSTIEIRQLLDKLTPYLSLELDLPEKRRSSKAASCTASAGNILSKYRNRQLTLICHLQGMTASTATAPRR